MQLLYVYFTNLVSTVRGNSQCYRFYIIIWSMTVCMAFLLSWQSPSKGDAHHHKPATDSKLDTVSDSSVWCILIGCYSII